MGMKILSSLIWCFLIITYVVANPWAQPNYDWKQQRASPFPGPEYLPYPSYKTLLQLNYGSSIVGAPAGDGIIYAVQTFLPENGYHAYGLITAYNTTTLKVVWREQPPVKLSSYQVSNPVVTSNGSLLVAISSPYEYRIPVYSFVSIVQMSSSGYFENSIAINLDDFISAFFLGPQDEIIGYNEKNQWYLLGEKQSGPFQGTPLACDDSGAVYVNNRNSLYKANLSNPSVSLWSTCPAASLCDSEFYLLSTAVSFNQTSVITAVCGDYFNSECLVVSLNAETGATEWVYVIFEGPIGWLSVAGQYLYVSYGGGPSTLAVLDQKGFAVNTYYMGSLASNFVGDQNGNIVLLNNTYYEYMEVATVSPRGLIAASMITDYDLCLQEDTSVFFTSLGSIWVLCSQQLGVVTLSL